jgi:hypothetical protein
MYNNAVKLKLLDKGYVFKNEAYKKEKEIEYEVLETIWVGGRSVIYKLRDLSSK